MDETKFLEYYNDLTRQIADPIIDNVNYINLRVTGNGLHAFVNYCLEKEREANKANSENANCAIFDVSGLLRELIMRGNYCAPMTEQDLIWFEEGTDHKKCKDFMLKIFEFVGEQ